MLGPKRQLFRFGHAVRARVASLCNCTDKLFASAHSGGKVQLHSHREARFASWGQRSRGTTRGTLVRNYPKSNPVLTCPSLSFIPFHFHWPTISVSTSSRLGSLVARLRDSAPTLRLSICEFRSLSMCSIMEQLQYLDTRH